MTHAQSVSFLLSEAIGKTGEFLADHKNLCYAAAFMSAERCQQILDPTPTPTLSSWPPCFMPSLAMRLRRVRNTSGSTRQLGVELSAARKARQRQKKGDGA